MPRPYNYPCHVCRGEACLAPTNTRNRQRGRTIVGVENFRPLRVFTLFKNFLHFLSFFSGFFGVPLQKNYTK